MMGDQEDGKVDGDDVIKDRALSDKKLDGRRVSRDNWRCEHRAVRVSRRGWRGVKTKWVVLRHGMALFDSLICRIDRGSSAGGSERRRRCVSLSVRASVCAKKGEI